MANIKVKVDYAISDGTKLRFRTPCESTEVEGLVVTYPIQNGIGYAVKTFSFVDAHGTELSGVGNVFTSDVMIGVLLDVTKGRAYIKNADTNSYIEDIKYSMEKMDEERQEIFAEAGKSVVECKDATKSANAAAQTAKDAAAGVVTIEQNSQDELRFWVGTEEEYGEQKDTFSANTFCVITNDTTEEEILAATKETTEKVNGLSDTVNGLSDTVLELQKKELETTVKRQVIYHGDAASEGACDAAGEKIPLINYIVATLDYDGSARRVMFTVWYESQPEMKLVFYAWSGTDKYELTIDYLMWSYGNVYNSFSISKVTDGESTPVNIRKIEAFYVDDDYLVVRS